MKKNRFVNVARRPTVGIHQIHHFLCRVWKFILFLGDAPRLILKIFPIWQMLTGGGPLNRAMQVSSYTEESSTAENNPEDSPIDPSLCRLRYER